MRRRIRAHKAPLLVLPRRIATRLSTQARKALPRAPPPQTATSRTIQAPQARPPDMPR
jgi:hypothetical protein